MKFYFALKAGMGMRLTTLCYVEKNGCYLMMHRIKKNHDENQGKWIGIGGHLEENESPEECIVREAMEETGLRIHSLKLRGILTFILPEWGNELTFLFTAEAEGEVPDSCAEGVLKWIPKEEVLSLNLWEGDRCFLPLLQSRRDCFLMKLIYAEGGKLLSCNLDGSTILEHSP